MNGLSASPPAVLGTVLRIAAFLAVAGLIVTIQRPETALAAAAR